MDIFFKKGDPMPIYEFYCTDCHVIFNFFSSTVNTTKKPKCPRCKNNVLSRQVSRFAVTGKAKEDGDLDDFPLDEAKMEDLDDFPLDEAKMEKAMQALAGEADKINEDDPRQAANMMRKLSDMTGLKLGRGMEEALARMESGEDPEQIEAEMGNLLEEEDPFELPGKKRVAATGKQAAPFRDERLYDL
jgi:putative FmdB family regulatory protein